MLGIGGSTAGEEVPAKSSAWLTDVEDAVEILAIELLAVQELRHCLDLLPSLGRPPFAPTTVCSPFATQILVGKYVGPIVQVVSVTVDRHAIRLSIPGAHRGLEELHVVAHVNLFGDPVWHRRGESFAENVTFPGCAAFKNVEVDRATGNTLLNAGEDFRLRQIDPLDFGPGVLLPGASRGRKTRLCLPALLRPMNVSF